MGRKKKSVLNQEVPQEPVVTASEEVVEEITETPVVEVEPETPVVEVEPEERRVVGEELLTPEEDIEKALESIDIIPVTPIEEPVEEVNTETPMVRPLEDKNKPMSVVERRRRLRYGMKPQ